ncbi:MAG: cyanophycin synthetase [Candidatus Pacebacteria bacterium]|nr:cyanophycin synthetase [Candidatus Paceibacterota bacterium]
MSKKTEPLILLKILKEITPIIGAKITIEPEWKIAGQITFKNGKHSYFKFNSLDINPFGSANLAKDKDYANFFMQNMGYKTVPNSKTFFSESWARAVGKPNQNIDASYTYSKQLGFPIIVKPNSGHQGLGVALVYNKQELYKAMGEIFKSDNIALVQPFVKGDDYRIVVLDNKTISAYQRIPLNVTGDGKSTIRQLLETKSEILIKNGRNVKIKLNDIRIKNKLKHQKLTLDSILEKKQLVYLLDSANLSTGGDSIDVTKTIHPKFKKLAINLTRDMNLRLCGVDLIIDGDISNKPRNYWILEINASPGLDHYAKLGKEQAEIVKSLYINVLKHLEKRPK